jgi:hypothetical protein
LLRAKDSVDAIGTILRYPDAGQLRELLDDRPAAVRGHAQQLAAVNVDMAALARDDEAGRIMPIGALFAADSVRLAVARFEIHWLRLREWGGYDEGMNTNPYTPPKAPSNHLLRRVIQTWIKYRKIPPTVAGLFLSWGSMPCLAVAGLALLLVLDVPPDSREFLWMFEGSLIGAGLRDFIYVRRFVLLWGIQRDYLDWGKIDTTSGDLRIISD